jgi:toxin FitB
MKLIDTNILIYSADPQFATQLLPIVIDRSHFFSEISRIETLGYHKITPAQVVYFHSLFKILYPLPIEDAVIQEAVRLRQSKKMSLGDSLIAATALVNNLELVTHHVIDFIWIPGIRVLDPMP